MLAGGFSMTILALCLSLTFWETANMASEVIILFVAGIGLGAVWQSVFLTAQASSDVKSKYTYTYIYPSILILVSFYNNRLID
jgi:hypothetical protein